MMLIWVFVCVRLVGHWLTNLANGYKITFSCRLIEESHMNVVHFKWLISFLSGKNQFLPGLFLPVVFTRYGRNLPTLVHGNIYSPVAMMIIYVCITHTHPEQIIHKAQCCNNRIQANIIKYFCFIILQQEHYRTHVEMSYFIWQNRTKQISCQYHESYRST